MRQARYPIPQGSRGRGALDLVFDGVTPLDSRLTFTRASTGTYVNSAGIIATALSNEPRINYDPVSLACKGLLIEETRTNLLTYSEQFDNAAWTKGNLTVAANAVTAPDGTLTADKVVESTALSAYHYTSSTLAKSASAITYTYSVFVKDAGRQLELSMSDGVGGVSMRVNPATGTVVAAASVYGAFTSPSGTISAFPDGWYRCTLTATTPTTTILVAQCATHTGSSNTYTGDGTSGLYLWGAQLEAGAFATSYIPTVASQVTRAADVATITGANFVSWYNQTEGTFVCEFEGNKNGVYINVSDASNTNRLPQCGIGSAMGYECNIVAGGVLTSSIVPSGTHTPGIFAKVAHAYISGSYAASANASVVATSAGTIATGVTRLQVGSYESGNNVINGHIKRLTYYPTRLTNTQLQELSI